MWNIDELLRQEIRISTCHCGIYLFSGDGYGRWKSAVHYVMYTSMTSTSFSNKHTKADDINHDLFFKITN